MFKMATTSRSSWILDNNTKSKTKTEILRVKSEAWLCIGPHHASQGSQQKEINLGGVGGGEIVDACSITKKGRGFDN